MLGKMCPNLLLHIHLVTNVWVVLPGRIKNTDGGKITQ
jgi:mannose-6-phosphate isomerase-like protein (cupin superfamily)